MDFALAGHVATILGGFLYLGLATLLLRHAAGRPANVALALLFVVFAAGELLFLAGRVSGDRVWSRIAMYCVWAQAPLVLAFAASHLGPGKCLPRWCTRLWPYGLLVIALGVWTAIESSAARPIFFAARDATPFLWVNLFLTVGFALVPLLLVRNALDGAAPRAASDLLLAIGVALWWATTSVDILVSAAFAGGVSAPAIASAGIRSLLTVWLLVILAMAPRRRPDLARLSRAGWIVVLGTLAIGVGAAGAWALAPAMSFASAVTWMLLAPLVVTYAILRHQMLGVDVKLRFAISKSTVAAAFIAALFLASEAAQLVFGAGNEWVGLFAAGALVFAMAPLQRAAERLAERAVPVATPAAPRASSDKEEAYKRAVSLALRGGITRDEEVHLHEVAEHMGIGAGRAMALRLEAERQLADDAREVT